MDRNIISPPERQVRPAPHALLLPVLFLVIFSIPAGLRADYMPLPLVSGDFFWEASTDGVNWIPAYPDYPNGLTIPFPATTDGVFMWYWDISKGSPNGTNGPNTVYFRSTFMLTDLHDKSVGAWIAADDWINLRINGVSATTYQLELNFNNEQQPIPKFVDFTDLINTRYQGNMTGYNTITIEAHDGGPIAYSRAYEWLFFDAHNVNSTPILDSPSKLNETPSNVPEPSVAAMFWIGFLSLLLLAFVRKRSGGFGVNRVFFGEPISKLP